MENSGLRSWVETRSRGAIAGIALVLLATVGAVDLVTGSELSFSVFYVLPISLVAWRSGRRAGTSASLAGGAVWLLVDRWAGHVYQHPLIPYWNSLVRVAFFLLISQLLVGLRDALAAETLSARTDPLTGLANRREFETLADRELDRARRTGRPVTVAVLDIDDFKGLNDRLGHHAGDAALRRLAEVAARELRSIDVLARLGGDEFAFVLPDAAPNDARAVLERVRSALGRRSVGRPPISCSIGAVTYESPPPDLAGALAEADLALYRAKGAGKGVVELVVVPVPPGQTDRAGAAA